MPRASCSSPLGVVRVLFVLLTLSITVNGLYTDSHGLLMRQEEEQPPASSGGTSSSPASSASSVVSGSNTSSPVASLSSRSTSVEASTSTEPSSSVSSLPVSTSSRSSSSNVVAPTPLPVVASSSSERTSSSATPTPPAQQRVESSEPSVATTLVVGGVTITSTRSNPGPAPTFAGATTNSDPFWGNKGAVGGTFGAVGLIGAGIMAAIVVGMIRRQRQRHTEGRETVGWTDHKPSDDPFVGAATRRPHYLTHGARSPSVSEMANRTPMNAYGSRDPFSDSHAQQVAPTAYRPYASEAPGTPSVYSQNLAGQGTVMDAQGLPYASYRNATDPDAGLVPPSPTQDVHRASYDSFYGGNARQGQAL